MENTMVLCTKIKLYPLGDKDEVNRVYKYIRDGQYVQFKTMNILMSEFVNTYYETHPAIDKSLLIGKNNETKEDKKNREAKLKEIYNEQNNKFKELSSNITKANNSRLNNIIYPVGSDIKSLAGNKVRNDFSIALKNGLATGDRSINNYKKDNPLMTRGRCLKFYHNYKTDEEFFANLFTEKCELNLHWVNKINFKVILGSNVKKTMALRNTIRDIFNKKVLIKDSSLMVKDKEIILNLSLERKKNIKELDENIVVGVDLGLKVPAYVSLNTNGKEYVRKQIGNINDLLRVRTQLQNERKRYMSSLKMTAGGHGRKKKCKSFDKFKEREKNFAKNYQHKVSSEIIKFALKNNAKYINIENLSDNTFDNKLLSNWGYYQLQQFITYKAEKEGIIVRKINPYFTSQICSSCGGWNIDNRESQETFICKDCGQQINADRNASINIARSNLFIKDSDKKDKHTLFLEAMRYYDIDEDKYYKQKGILEDELGNISSDKNKKKKDTKKTNKKVA